MAVKIVALSAAEDEAVQNVLREVKAKQELHIFMELCPDGSLKGKIPAKGMTPSTAAYYLRDVLLGL
eukprot:gene11568-6005_t